MPELIIPAPSINVSDYSPYEGDFDTYLLRKWSLFIRYRDRKICQLCHNPYEIHELHAHHIQPKGYAEFAPFAYQLSNGIALCVHCHLAVVHSTDENWRQFYQLFWNQNRQRGRHKFNEFYQDRIARPAS